MRYLTYRPANGVKRTIAYLIDTIPIQLGLYLVSHVCFGVSPIADRTSPPDVQVASLQARMLIAFGTLGIWIIYCILGELSPMDFLRRRSHHLKVHSRFREKFTPSRRCRCQDHVHAPGLAAGHRIAILVLTRPPQETQRPVPSS